MDILLDTVNIEAIKCCLDIYDIAGVTSNPTIIAREKADFFTALYEIRKIIGDGKQLHVQVTAAACGEMLREAEAIAANFGKSTYIKVPADETGIKAIKLLKRDGYNVTATAVYTVQQGMLAASVGADYVAPYFNRMCGSNYDPVQAISDMAKLFGMNGGKTKILAASFKNTYQILQALLAGADAVTADPQLYSMMLQSPLVDSAVKAFREDWAGMYQNRRIYEL